MKGYIVRQEEEKDCGASSLASIIKYYNGFVPLEVVRCDTLTDNKGTNFYNIKMAALKYGFDSVGIINQDVSPPYIVQTRINNFNHFMVVYEKNKDNVVVMDPAVGLTKYTYQEFNKIFTGYILKLIPNGKIVRYKKKNVYLDYLKNLAYKNKFKVIICLIFTIILIFLSIFQSILIKDILLENKYLNIFITIILMKLIINFIKNECLIKLNKKINLEIINNYLSKYFNLPYKYLHLKSVGDITNRIKDLNKIKNYLSTEIINFILNVSLGLVSLIILLYLDLKLTFIVISIYIVAYLISIKLNKIILKNYNDLMDKDNNYMDHICEYIEKIITISSLNLNSYFKKKLDIYSKNVTEANYLLDRNNNYLNTLMETVNSLSLIVILGCLSSNLKIVMIYLLYFDYLKDTFNYLITIKPIIKYLKMMIDRISGIYYLECDNKSEGYLFNNGDIIVSKLNYYIGLNKIINNKSFKIKQGSKVLINGNNGSGKSTLINILTKNIIDYDGKIIIGNLNLNDISYNSYLDNLSYVNQNSYLFEDTIINNIILDNELDKDRLNKIIKIVNLEDAINKKENKLNTIVRDNFSGGEKQKIIIARSLYKNFNILILDEAFSEIAVRERIKIINKINEVYNDKTIIYVNHFNDDINYNQIIYILNDRKEKCDE